MPMVSAAREHGVSPITIHRWKSRYGEMTLSELRGARRKRKREPERGGAQPGTICLSSGMPLIPLDLPGACA